MNINFIKIEKKKKYAFLIMFLLLSIAPILSMPNKNKSEDKIIKIKPQIEVHDKSRNQVVTISIRELVCGTLAAEMPISFEIEAIKAQMVAIFTYFIYNLGDKTMVINSASSFYYKNMKKRKEQWGSNFEKYENKIKSAFDEVSYQVLTFEKKIALTTFFASCKGETLPSQIGFIKKIPYLTNVSSPEHEDWYKDRMPAYKSKFENTIIIKIEDMKKMIIEWISKRKIKCTVEKLDKTHPTQWFSKKNESGFIELLGDPIKISFLRQLLSLCSNNFQIKCNQENSNFEITTSGNGHGVGMSQHGANAFAKQGKNYEEILLHYYPGTKISKIEIHD
ncbi:MAG: SpoIID/LytB domain-containing protein [Firmicutes bacterium]|nr:SpoIID/LytB domain-containing protein [Bacillota bacterium]